MTLDIDFQTIFTLVAAVIAVYGTFKFLGELLNRGMWALYYAANKLPPEDQEVLEATGEDSDSLEPPYVEPKDWIATILAIAYLIFIGLTK